MLQLGYPNMPKRTLLIDLTNETRLLLSAQQKRDGRTDVGMDEQHYYIPPNTSAGDNYITLHNSCRGNHTKYPIRILSPHWREVV